MADENKEMWELFHKLWGIAHGHNETYVKKEWSSLSDFIWKLEHSKSDSNKNRRQTDVDHSRRGIIRIQ